MSCLARPGLAPVAAAASVPALLSRLRLGELPLLGYLAELEQRLVECEPAIQAFLPEPGRWERLRADAQALLAAYPQPDSRPPLWGLPVAVKDIFNVAGLPTRAGSRLPTQLFSGPQAAAVTALRAAGALVLGKAVSTEFAYFAPGPTRNPQRPEHTPGGSSSGSAAAVAAGLAPLALGTQTIGSIIRPAAFCGVVGFKPSYERISRAGVVPLAPALDHVGLFALDVAGIDVAARGLCHDWQPARPGARPVLGVPTGPYLDQASPVALTHFQAVCRRLEAAGCAVRLVPAMADFAEIRARHGLIVAAEAAQVHAAWFAEYRALYHPKTAELIERGQAAPAADLALARDGRQALRAELTRLMEAHGVDLWIAPAAVGPAPRGLDSTGDPIMNLPWTHSGLPALTLPSGLEGGLPLGLQVVAGWQADEQLLAWAADLETAWLT